MKQFLYDWAPPAFDHPCLWRSNPIPFHVGQDIGWLGTDFKQARAASVSIDRTMIELAVLRGDISDDELQMLCRSLVPVDVEARDRILSTPFAELCYQHRHEEQTHHLPCGLYSHRRDPTTKLRISTDRAASRALSAQRFTDDKLCGYEFNTVFWFEDSSGQIKEVEYLYERDDPAGNYLRLLFSPTATDAIRVPPVLGDHPCFTRAHVVSGVTVFHAFVSEKYGPHEAVWQQSGLTVMALTKPMITSNDEWFLRVVRELIEHGGDTSGGIPHLRVLPDNMARLT